MKKNVLFLLGIMITVVSYGFNYSQMLLKAEEKSPPKFAVVEKGQQFGSISDYMTKFVRYPEGTDSFGLIGTEVVEFVVTSTGQLTKFNVINSISFDIDQEVIRVLRKTSGRWNPGLVNGQPVDMKREVSVVFKPNANYNLVEIAKKIQNEGNQHLLVNKDPKKAIKQYNRAILMYPYEGSALAARSLSKYEIGDEKGASKDMERIKYLNKTGVLKYKAANLNPAMKHLKGYTKLSALLQ